ncbi:MAG: RnfABCDGE type electron transport complex subunit G [Candidatus Omnitrophica bacterium]|nr:RnfABCDGE type electron transport complex subunit G [Candidatus Omnitrophota bacterium]
MKRELVKYGALLMGVCACSGLLLTAVYKLTEKRIREQKLLEERLASQEVLPDATTFKKETRKGETIEIGSRNGKKIGEVYLVTTRGYSGEIKLKVGVDLEGKITGIKILESLETPGLGAKIKEKKFLEQFRGKDRDKLYLRKKIPSGDIDSITGATISSAAVIDAIREKLSSP